MRLCAGGQHRWAPARLRPAPWCPLAPDHPCHPHYQPHRQHPPCPWRRPHPPCHQGSIPCSERGAPQAGCAAASTPVPPPRSCRSCRARRQRRSRPRGCAPRWRSSPRSKRRRRCLGRGGHRATYVTRRSGVKLQMTGVEDLCHTTNAVWFPSPSQPPPLALCPAWWHPSQASHLEEDEEGGTDLRTRCG